MVMEKALKNEKEVFKEHEPNMYKAVINVFGESYAYLDAYRAFAKEERNKKRFKKKAEKYDGTQMTIFDFISA